MQVVWDTSYRLGCGAKFCASVTSSSITRGHIVVCQYGPGWVDYNVQQSCTKLICVGGVWDSPTPPAYILQCLTLMSSQNGGRKRSGYTGLVWVCWDECICMHMKVWKLCKYLAMYWYWWLWVEEWPDVHMRIIHLSKFDYIGWWATYIQIITWLLYSLLELATYINYCSTIV